MPDRITRILLCGFVFIITLLIELVLIWLVVPSDAVTASQIDEFLLISAYWLLIPLALALLLFLFVFVVLVLIALVPAHKMWLATSPDAPARWVSTLLKTRREFLKASQAERTQGDT
jgi:heme/copper-type cytochrome/quinol oxidase subunit 2